jgi:hypothetical protein
MKLTNAKSIDHIRLTAIVHAASIPETAWGGPGVDHYVADAAGHALTTQKFKLPKLDGQILAAWYTVHDRCHSVASFEVINVHEVSATEVTLEVSLKKGAPDDYLRIAIHLLTVSY